MQKKILGRPRKHEVGKWTTVHIRMPKDLRAQLLYILELKNEELPYRLSMNSFILELIQKTLKEE